MKKKKYTVAKHYSKNTQLRSMSMGYETLHFRVHIFKIWPLSDHIPAPCPLPTTQNSIRENTTHTRPRNMKMHGQHPCKQDSDFHSTQGLNLHYKKHLASVRRHIRFCHFGSLQLEVSPRGHSIVGATAIMKQGPKSPMPPSESRPNEYQILWRLCHSGHSCSPISVSGHSSLLAWESEREEAGRRDFSTEISSRDGLPWDLCTWRPSWLRKAPRGKWRTGASTADPRSHVFRWVKQKVGKQQCDSGGCDLSRKKPQKTSKSKRSLIPVLYCCSSLQFWSAQNCPEHVKDFAVLEVFF